MRLLPSLLGILFALPTLGQDSTPSYWLTGGLEGGLSDVKGHFTFKNSGTTWETELPQKPGGRHSSNFFGGFAEARIKSYRFALTVSGGREQPFTSGTIDHDCVIKEITYPAGTNLETETKTAAVASTAGLIFSPKREAWLSLDGGLHYWELRLRTEGTGYARLEGNRLPWLSHRQVEDEADFVTPCLGLSGGIQSQDGKWHFQGTAQVGGYSRNSTTLLRAQAQYFVLRHFGLSLSIERWTAAKQGKEEDEAWDASHFARRSIALGVVTRW